MIHMIVKEVIRYLDHSLSCKATDMVLCQNINGSNCIKTLNAFVVLNASKSKNIPYNRKGHQGLYSKHLMYGFLRTENGHEAWLTSEIPSREIPGATELRNRRLRSGWQLINSDFDISRPRVSHLEAGRPRLYGLERNIRDCRVPSRGQLACEPRQRLLRYEPFQHFFCRLDRLAFRHTRKTPLAATYLGDTGRSAAKETKRERSGSMISIRKGSSRSYNQRNRCGVSCLIKLILLAVLSLPLSDGQTRHGYTLTRIIQH